MHDTNITYPSEFYNANILPKPMKFPIIFLNFLNQPSN
jgi:hypothetical protein